MNFRIYRDWDQRLRLRKVVIECYNDEGQLLDRARCFAGCFFKHRLRRKLRAMKWRCEIMLGARLYVDSLK